MPKKETSAINFINHTLNRSIILLFIIILFQSTNLFTAPFMTIKINKTEISTEIANTNATRKKGLQFRDSLKEDTGMLFIFEKPKTLSFWMKETKIPLSIAFIDSAGKIIQIEKMKPYSLKHAISIKPCVFALEVNQGFFKKHNIKVGDEVHF